MELQSFKKVTVKPQDQEDPASLEQNSLIAIDTEGSSTHSVSDPSNNAEDEQCKTTEGTANANVSTRDKQEYGPTRSLLFLLLIPSFVEKVAERMSIPILPVFATNEFRASPKTVGAIVAFVALGKIMANVPSGWLVSQCYNSVDGKSSRMKPTMMSRSGPLFPIVLSCLVLASACIGAACSSTPLALIGARLWEGAGLSLWVIGRQTLMNDILTKENRGRYMSTLGGIARMASIVGPFLSGMLARTTTNSSPGNTLRRPFYVQALLHGMNAILIVGIMLWLSGLLCSRSAASDAAEGEEDIASLLTAIDNTESENDTEEQRDCSLKQQASSLSHSSSYSSSTQQDEPMSWVQVASHFGPALAKLAVFSFCINVTRESRHLLFPLQAMNLGYEAHDIGIMTSITFFMDSTMFPAAGYLMDRYGRKFAGVPALLIMSTSLASVPVLMKLFPSSSSFIMLTLASAGCGIGNGLSSGLLMSMAGDASPTKGQDRAKFFALFRTCADTGLLLGPWVSGMLAEHWSVDVGFEVVAGIALIGAVWMAFAMDN